MYCLYECLGYSHASIGFLIGERDYGTSIHAIKTITNLKDSEPRIKLLVKLTSEFIKNEISTKEEKSKVFNELLEKSNLSFEEKLNFKKRYGNGK